jgi:hypothetical protein
VLRALEQGAPWSLRNLPNCLVGKYPRQRMDEQQEFEQVELVWPTAEEVRAGYTNLQICWPTWKANLGLLVTSENDLGLVVSAIDYSHDDFDSQFGWR